MEASGRADRVGPARPAAGGGHHPEEGARRCGMIPKFERQATRPGGCGHGAEDGRARAALRSGGSRRHGAAAGQRPGP